MGLRREFSEHKGKTMAAFGLVSHDISMLSQSLASLKAALASAEEKINEINQNLKADIQIQNSTNASMASKIVDINSFVNARISNFEREIGKIEQKIQAKVKDSVKEVSKKTNANSSLLKQAAASLKSQSLELKKLKNLLDRDRKASKKSDLELDANLRSHKRRMQQLNRKIDMTAAVSAKRVSRAARKTRKAPRKTKKIKITKKTTPKKIAEVLQEKKHLI